MFDNPLFDYYNIFQNNNVAEFTAIAPSPHKDFYHLLITKEKISWRWWRITPRNEAAKFNPGEMNFTYQEFLSDDKTQKDIRRILGLKTLRYVAKIAEGMLDFLPRLPQPIIHQIIKNICLEDLKNLECTCRALQTTCNDENVWAHLYKIHHPEPINEVVVELGKLFGWKRVFFTSKLKLQMQIRRLRMEKGAGDDELCSILSRSFSQDESEYHDKDVESLRSSKNRSSIFQAR